MYLSCPIHFKQAVLATLENQKFSIGQRLAAVHLVGSSVPHCIPTPFPWCVHFQNAVTMGKRKLPLASAQASRMTGFSFASCS